MINAKKIKKNQCRASFIFVISVIIAFLSCKESKKIKSESSVPYPSITDTYKNVFPTSAFKYIRPSFTFFSRERSPIATFKVLNADYSILVYKTSMVNKQIPLSKIIKIKWTNDIDISGLYHSVVDNSQLKFTDADELVSEAKTLCINIDADLVAKPKYADSLLSFNLKFRTANGRYDNHENPDFTMAKPKPFLITNIPVQMLFFKKNSAIYMIISSPKKLVNKSISPEFLYKLVTSPY